MTITELSIKRPILFIVIFIALALVGCFAYSKLKYELFPDIDVKAISISTAYKGASASVVESLVTKPIEDAVAGIGKIDTVSSNSNEGNSRITIQFTQDADVDYCLQEVERKVNSILKNLPSGISTPTFAKFSIDDMPIMRVGLTSNLPATRFYDLMDHTIAPQVSQVAGVGDVSISGGQEREIQVNLDAQKMQGYGLSPLAILSAVEKGNEEYPTGKVSETDREFTIRLAGKYQSIDDLKQCIVGQNAGGMICLSDVAEIVDGKEDFDASNGVTMARVNGENTLALMIRKQSDANTVEVSRLVRRKLAQLEERYRQYHLGIKVASDSSTFIVSSANAVKEDLLLAILLVAGVMLLFLHSFRNSLIVMVAIPTSLVTTFIGMWVYGCTLNVITLLALSLVIGILVDDAIVVLENIYRHLEAGEDQKAAALEGRNEIGFTALSITLVDVAVYLPMMMVTGMIGGMLRQFSLVIVVSTLTSLFVSFTVTPMLASRYSKLQPLSSQGLMGRFGNGFENIYNRISGGYLKILRICLASPRKVLAIAGILFILTLALIPLRFIGTEFIAGADQAQITVDIQLPSGSKLVQTNEGLQKVEGIVSRMPGVKMIYAEAGKSSGNSLGDNYGYVNVLLVAKEQRSFSTDQFGEKVRQQLQGLVGMKVYISQPNIIGGGGSAPVQVAINGPSWDIVMDTALRIRKIMEQIPGTSDVKLSSNDGNPEMSILVNREKMKDLGLDIKTVGQTLALGLTGNTKSFYTENGLDYNINVRLDKSSRMYTKDLGNLIVVNNRGEMIPLNQFTTIRPTTGPSVIQRRNRSFSVSVTSQTLGRSTGDIGKDISNALRKERLPDSVNIAFVGNIKNQADSFKSLAVALIAAIVFVYLIMAALYNSFIYPFSVIFAIPLAVIGALLALALTKKTLSIFSVMGLIMLVGLVSKNAILLVDFTNRAREEGLGMEEALIEAGRERLRPILMTTMTMILGMIPLATSSATGSEFKNGLGWVLIGGLTCSMLMTLVVVPVVYTRIEKIRVFLLQTGRRETWKKKSV
ncbi:MAG TPA: acriflavin resistance protein [Firmicutes bacterium]|jgi:hydrophobic/amphiphilic exporter-1 (mainly G- bacteria), HAE1 family|nr:acriflavin resistance protein [Bacillota bacterium]